MAKGDGKGSEWKIPQPGDEGYPWDTRTSAQRSTDMQAYIEKYGIDKMADEGWKLERERLEREQAEYDARPDVRAARDEAARAAAEHTRIRAELTQRIHILVPNTNPRKIGSELDRCSAEELRRLYHGGMEWGSIRPEGQSDYDRAAKQEWDQLLFHFGYVPVE